tara:strand:- start:923 stop:1408 length:486 start_codon:yes stop_codon:yes gene_type:complete
MVFCVAASSFLVKSSITAYIHYLSFILCFGALTYERISVKPNPQRNESIAMLCADIVYGIAGIALLVSGILRVKYYGQGDMFYTQNPLFWVKIVLFACVGLLSLYPTFTYILWAIPLSKGTLPKVNDNLAKRLRLIVNIELLGFVSIPLMATLMARGIGLP